MTCSANIYDMLYVQAGIFEGPFFATPNTFKNQDIKKISANFRMCGMP